MTEPDPISLAEGKRRRDEVLASFDGEEYDAWTSSAETLVVKWLKAGRTRITSEQITLTIGYPPGDHRRIGGAIRKIMIAHNMRKIGPVPSVRPGRHAGPVTVWERL